MAPATGSDLTVLGIESSCDDTAAAVVRRADGRPQVLSSVVLGQTGLHAPFGGVVPEIAARAHSERLDLAVEWLHRLVTNPKKLFWRYLTTNPVALFWILRRSQ